MKELITALIKAAQEFEPIRKDRQNPFLKSKYATLDSVLESVEPALHKNGLKIVQILGFHESGAPVLRTLLYHESGESIVSEYPLILSDDPQKFGAAVTYARRYALCAALSVTADEDDDAEAAKPSGKSGNPPSKPVVVKIDRERLMKQTTNHMKAIGWGAKEGSDYLKQKYGVATRNELSDQQLQDFSRYLQSKTLLRQ
jgi:hypothetical protein